MTEEVLVRVTGIQRSGQQPEENDEPISIVTPGRFYMENGHRYVKYEEVFEEPQTVDDGTIYRVKKSAEGENVLGYIGKIGVKLWRLPEY